MNREETILRMATAYYDFLKTNKTIFFSNPDVYIGIKEGLNKFLSNLAIRLRGKYNINTVEYISVNALNIINKKDVKNLIYEHMVPKEIYIQCPCLDAIKNDRMLTKEEIYELLNKYWYIALITREEDNLLNKLKLRTRMPQNWDKNNIFARYELAKIPLIDVKTLNKKGNEI
jgi:hypothetical protein